MADAFALVAEAGGSVQRTDQPVVVSHPTTEIEDRRLWPEHVIGRVRSAQAAYATGSLGPVERIRRLVKAADEPIAGSSVVFLDEELVSRAASVAEDRWRDGSERRLEGVTVGVKDIVDVADLPTGAGLGAGSPDRPSVDSAIVSQLRSDGAIPFAKLRTYEYAWAEDSGKDPVINPVGPGVITGGSSNGSAAAVGFGLVDVAIGSDTLGSTRAPAAFCGVVGLKVSQGRISTDGMVALAPSLDCLGLLGGSVHDVAQVWETFAGGRRPVRARSPRAGVIATGPQSNSTISALGGAVTVLEEAGWSVDECGFKRLDEAAAAGLVIVAVESSQQEWANQGRSDLSPSIVELLEAGRNAPPASFEAAMSLRQSVSIELSTIFETCDVILSPVTPGSAPRVDTLDFLIGGDRIPWLDIANVFLAWSNLAGLSSVSVPVRLEADGTVTSLQITAAKSAEETALMVASILEWSL